MGDIYIFVDQIGLEEMGLDEMDINPSMIVACLVDNNNLIWDAHLDAFVLQKDQVVADVE